MLDRIKKMNAGYENVPYFVEGKEDSLTDNNLIKLFDKLGYDVMERQPDLFFTNFCLGYRRDKEVKMTKELMIGDAPLFKELCEILEPENIICMGRLTFECVHEALTGEPNEELLQYQYFNDFLDNHKPITIRLKGNSVPVIVVPHCGKWGIFNRNWNIDDPLALQFRDWIEIKKLIKEYEHETVEDAIENRRASFSQFLFKLLIL